MECKGCQADLSKGRDVPIHMTLGRLYLSCPLCKYESILSVDADGRLHLFNQEDVMFKTSPVEVDEVRAAFQRCL